MSSCRKESLQCQYSRGSGWKRSASVSALELRASVTSPCHQNPSPSWLQSGMAMSGSCAAVRPWQGKGREQRKQEGRRSCTPSLLLIILPFRFREAVRPANTMLVPYLGKGRAVGTEGGHGAGLDIIQITLLQELQKLDPGYGTAVKLWHINLGVSFRNWPEVMMELKMGEEGRVCRLGLWWDPQKATSRVMDGTLRWDSVSTTGGNPAAGEQKWEERGTANAAHAGHVVHQKRLLLFEQLSLQVIAANSKQFCCKNYSMRHKKTSTFNHQRADETTENPHRDFKQSTIISSRCIWLLLSGQNSLWLPSGQLSEIRHWTCWSWRQGRAEASKENSDF